jgi:hypothetical protein
MVRALVSSVDGHVEDLLPLFSAAGLARHLEAQSFLLSVALKGSLLRNGDGYADLANICSR